MNCDSELLSAYHDGELSPLVRQQVEAHLTTCAPCQAVLRQYRGLAVAIRQLDRRPVPATLSTRFHSRAQPDHRRAISRLAGLLSPVGFGRPIAVSALGTVAAALVVAFALNLWPLRAPDRSTVVVAYPPDGASGVARDEPLEFVFSKPVDPEKVSVQVYPPAQFESTVDGDKLIVRPTEPLQPDTRYTVIVSPKAQVSPPAASPAGPAPQPPAPTAAIAFTTGQTIASAASPTAPAGGTGPSAVAAVTTPRASPSAGATPAGSATAVAAVAPTHAPTQPAGPAAVSSPSPRPTQAIAVAEVGLTPAGLVPPCGAEPGPAAERILRLLPEARQRLGCALSAERGLAVVEQSYEGGMMLLLPDRREVDVLAGNGKWTSFPDVYQPATSTPARPISPTPAMTLNPTLVPAVAPTMAPTLAPTSGLARVYQEQAGVRSTLGRPTSPEASRLAYVQLFARGLTVSLDAASVHALYDDGTWQKLPLVGTPVPALASATPTPGATATPTQSAVTATPIRPIPTATTAATPTVLATTPASPTATAAATPQGAAPTATPSAVTSTPSSPVPTSTSTPESPAISPTVAPTPAQTLVPSPTATPLSIPTSTPPVGQSTATAPTPTLSPTATLTPTPSESLPSPTPPATAHPSATATPAPTPTESPPPTATAMFQPTSQPSSSSTPLPITTLVPASPSPTSAPRVWPVPGQGGGLGDTPKNP